MNEQLQQALTAILNKTMSGVDAGVDFLTGQIPEVIQQLLVWKMAQAGILLATVAICFSLSLWGTIRGIKTQRKYDKANEMYRHNHNNEAERVGKAMMEEAEKGLVLAYISFGTIIFFGPAFVFCSYFSISRIAQILIAPKIYLIEYAASLAK